MAKFILGATMALVLAGCGGGSGSSPFSAPETCTPQVVSVALIGDSTQYGLDSFTGMQAIHNPGIELQAKMDAEFGAGAVVVTDYGVVGSMAHNAPKVTADVIVANYGINDAANSIPTADFIASMRATGATLIETPSPTSDPTIPGTGAYVSTELAMGLPVADVHAYVLSLPDWQAMEHDKIHPGDALYVLIIDNVLAPAVAKQVAPLRCATVN